MITTAERNGTDIHVERLTVGGMHWYEAQSAETCKHLQWLLSVTHYTKHAPKGDHFLKWYADLGWDKAEQTKIDGGIRGSNVHKGQERLDWGEAIDRREFSEEEWKHLDSYVRWVNDWQPQFIANEEIVYDLDQGVAGTLDKRYVLPRKIVEARMKIDPSLIREEIDGIHVVHDSKTSKNLYEENHLQGHKYADLRNRMGVDPEVGLPVEWVAILRTASRHKSTYEFIIEPLCEARIRVFDCLKDVVDHFFPEKEPRFPPPMPDSLSL